MNSASCLFPPPITRHARHMHVATCFSCWDQLLFLVVSSQMAKYHYTRKCVQVLDVNCMMLLSDFNATWICSTDYLKKIQYKINEIPSGGRRVVACRLDGLSSALWRDVIW